MQKVMANNNCDLIANTYKWFFVIVFSNSQHLTKVWSIKSLLILDNIIVYPIFRTRVYLQSTIYIESKGQPNLLIHSYIKKIDQKRILMSFSKFTLDPEKFQRPSKPTIIFFLEKPTPMGRSLCHFVRLDVETQNNKQKHSGTAFALCEHCSSFLFQSNFSSRHTFSMWVGYDRLTN